VTTEPLEQLTGDEVIDVRRLLRELHRDDWVGAPLLRGNLPTIPQVEILPTPSANYAYKPVILKGTPDLMYVCLRDSGGSWGWKAVDNAALIAVDFLVGTATGELSNEIVAGTAPGGELGGTWGTPTVDATHSGSSHADAQAAAEATAAAYTDSELGDHEAAADPHPTYTTAAELASGIATHAADDDAHHEPGWETIAEGFAGSTVSTITFSNLSHALYRLTLYVNQVTANDSIEVQFNSDTGSNYTDNGASAATSISICPVIADEHSMIVVYIFKGQDSEEGLLLSEGVQATASPTVTNVNLAGQWNNTDANITRIDLSQLAGSGQFGANTYYKLEGSGTPQ
jgi:hypothetical protein